jgi:hypothetical protein
LPLLAIIKAIAGIKIDTTVYLIESSTDIQSLSSKGCLSSLIQAMALIMASNGNPI